MGQTVGVLSEADQLKGAVDPLEKQLVPRQGRFAQHEFDGLLRLEGGSDGRRDLHGGHPFLHKQPLFEFLTGIADSGGRLLLHGGETLVARALPCAEHLDVPGQLADARIDPWLGDQPAVPVDGKAGLHIV